MKLSPLGITSLFYWLTRKYAWKILECTISEIFLTDISLFIIILKFILNAIVGSGMFLNLCSIMPIPLKSWHIISENYKDEVKHIRKCTRVIAGHGFDSEFSSCSQKWLSTSSQMKIHRYDRPIFRQEWVVAVDWKGIQYPVRRPIHFP